MCLFTSCLLGKQEVTFLMFHRRSRCGDRDEPSPKRIKTEVRQQSHQICERNCFGLSPFNDKSRVSVRRKRANVFTAERNKRKYAV